MLYLPFNVYLDSKRVSILIETVLPISMLYLIKTNTYIFLFLMQPDPVVGTQRDWLHMPLDPEVTIYAVEYYY